MGDPSGIGGEIIAKSLARFKDPAELVVIGDKRVFEASLKIKATNHKLEFIDLNNVPRRGFRFGAVNALYGRASLEYLDKAMEMLKARELDCLVTAPVSKEAISLGACKFKGHTEYLMKETNTKFAVMMLLNDRMRFSLLTRHIPLKDVARSISSFELKKNIMLVYRSLRDLFGIINGRIVVCGLNPHASDNGLLGKEENKLIKPVIKSLKSKVRHLAGPMPADIAVKLAFQGMYDCVVAMYHDQALIPLKLSGAGSGVNITLGLPFVRTSCLHGTAFDIAGRNIADESSMLAAIKLANKCALNQKKA